MRPSSRAWIAPLTIAVACAQAAAAQPARLAKTYADAVRKINTEHARKPGKTRESDLARRLPRSASMALEKLLAAEGGADLDRALADCGEAALDLDLIDDFEKLRRRLAERSPEAAAKLGTARSSPRAVLRGFGALDAAYLERFAEVLEAVLAAYDEVFGFEEWSKVPGKKLRVRIHLEEKITEPPHFAPQLPFHSEIDFPVVDPKELRSPTSDGKFLFYGLCHELGHVIAMWGDRTREADHHAWAHYTGVVIVDHLASKEKPPAFLERLRDVRWRSLAIERERLANARPSLEDRDGVLATLIALHDAAGARAIGRAINFLDREDRRPRINAVRYYDFPGLRRGLLATLEDPARKKAVAAILR